MTHTPSTPSGSVAIDATRSGGDGLIEAAWLAAAAVVPLMFNQHAFNSFEPFKAAIVRLAAAIIVAAWAIKACLERESPRANGLSRAVGIAFLGLLGTKFVATIFSVNPRPSFWDESHAEGLGTALAEAVLFLAVAVFLRRAAQVDRLISALVAGSIPAALYALIQRAGLDPIAYTGISERVFSTFGHPIFFAAYLGMVMPLTWWKIAREMLTGWPTVVERPRIYRLAFHAGVAVLQLAGFLCAQSRGPLLGLVAAAVFFFLGWAVQTRRRRWAFRIGAGMAVAAAFFVFLNLPLSASMQAARALRLERFTTTLGIRNGGDAFRKAHWNAGVELMTSTRPIVFPTGGSDRWHLLRPWIGYGPETLSNVLPQRYIWPSMELKSESRLHNRVLDLWCTTGALGTVAFLAFFLIVVQQGMEQAGLGSRRIIFLFLPGMGMLAGVLFCVIGGKGFLGLGIVFGVAAGCVLSVLTTARTGRDQTQYTENFPGRRLLIIAVLAALVGHLVETGFAFPVQATSFLFYLYAGLLLALAHVADAAPAQVVAPATKKAGKVRTPKKRLSVESDWRDGWRAAYAPTLILVSLIFAFVQVYSVDAIDWTTVLTRTLTQIRGDQGPSHLVWFLFVPTWLGCTFVGAAGSGGSRPVRWSIPLTISAAIGLAFAVAQAARIVEIGPLPRLNDQPSTALAQLSGYQGIYFTYIAVLLALLLGAAWLLSPVPTNGQKSSGRAAGWNLLAAGLGVAVTWFVAFRQVHGEITGTWGRSLVTFSRLEAGTEVLGQSVHELPHSIVYRCELSDAFVRRAQESHNYETFDWLARQAEAALIPGAEEARGMSTASARLARLYMPWAALTPDPGRRSFLAGQAAFYFGRQQVFAPTQAVSWLDSAVLDQFVHRPEEAGQKLAVAIGFMEWWRVRLWADAYRELTLGCGAPDLRQAYAVLVFQLYETAIGKARTRSESALSRMGRAMLNLGLGHLDEARQECLQVQSDLPAADSWQADTALAEIDRQTSHLAEAKIHIDKAIATAPAESKAMLLEMKRRIDGR